MHKCTAHAEVPHRWISTVKKPLCRRQKQSLLTWTTWWCDWVLYSDIFACLSSGKSPGLKLQKCSLGNEWASGWKLIHPTGWGLRHVWSPNVQFPPKKLADFTVIHMGLPWPTERGLRPRGSSFLGEKITTYKFYHLRIQLAQPTSLYTNLLFI